MPLIESGTISSPVEYLDIDLPSGYDEFILRLVDFRTSVNDFLVYALSPDAGGSFYNSAGAYLIQRFSSLAGDSTSLGYDDTVAPLGDSVTKTAGPMIASLEIFPGAVGQNALAMTSCGYRRWSDVPEFANLCHILNTTGKQNLMRLLPYGNGDVDPPTSGETFTTGSYFLYGIPTP